MEILYKTPESFKTSLTFMGYDGHNINLILYFLKEKFQKYYDYLMEHIIDFDFKATYAEEDNYIIILLQAFDPQSSDPQAEYVNYRQVVTILPDDVNSKYIDYNLYHSFNPQFITSQEGESYSKIFTEPSTIALKVGNKFTLLDEDMEALEPDEEPEWIYNYGDGRPYTLNKEAADFARILKERIQVNSGSSIVYPEA